MSTHSLYGRELGISTATSHLVSRGLDITRPCVDASITVGAEVENVRPIAIQLKDARGADINYIEVVEVLVVHGTNGLAAAATGGSTGIAASTDGAILATLEAKKAFLVSSEADGDIDLTWTDTGTESVKLAVRLPSGRIVLSDAFANAGE